MTTFSWGKTTRLISLAIRVKNRDKMIDFYKLLGFELKREENELAIFGTREKGSELLLLEESPRAKAHEGKARKMRRMSLFIPKREELDTIYSRLQKAEYPINEFTEDDAYAGFTVTDPEENELEVYCSRANSGKTAKEEPNSAVSSQKKAAQEWLSEGAYFDRLELNVPDISEERTFLQDIVGFIFNEESHGFELMFQGHFEVNLIKDDAEEILRLPTDQVHGLDFIKFTVDETDFNAFAKHLGEVGQEHFIDGKRSIITIYGPLGVEWWFVKTK